MTVPSKMRIAGATVLDQQPSPQSQPKRYDAACPRRRAAGRSTNSPIVGSSHHNNNSCIDFQTTFTNEPTQQECCIRRGDIENLEESLATGERGRCTNGREERENFMSLNEPERVVVGNDDKDDYSNTISSIFRTCFSGSLASNRNSKACNQVCPQSSSSQTERPFSSPSPLSPSSTWLLFLLVFSWNLSSTSSFCPPYCSCDDIALSVDCHSASNLQVVPIFLNPQVKFLSLSRNQIKDITMSLQFYSELQVLDISQNKLESLGKTNFESLKSLLHLNASYNLVKALENGVFTGLSHIRVLDLSGNQLERMEREVFWSLESIREIILDRNRLEFIDWELFHGLDSLEKISAKFNFIQVIEPSPSFSLEISGSASSTSSVGPVAGGLTSSANDDNNDDRARSSNNSNRTFTSSRSHGKVGSWSLKNVRYLDISSNQLTRVKNYGLVIFGALKELNLCCNYIHTLEEKAFVISPSKSSRVGHLERVNLSQNRLGRVPTETLEKLGPTLRQLDISSNRISDHISKNAFRNLIQLESLRVSDNPEILYIDPDALSENVNLINFEADYLSNVTDISPNLLKNKMFLENFSMKYASISLLSPEFFQPPVSDVVGCLDLTGNPIDCNCSAHSFYEFVFENRGASSSSYSFDSSYDFEQTQGDGDNIFGDEGNIRENVLRPSPSNDDRALRKSNFSSPHKGDSSNPNLISDQPTTSSSLSPRSRSLPKSKNSSSRNNKNNSNRPNLFYVRCQSPPNLAGVLVKDLKSSDFQHCFTPDDQVQIMVICIAAGICSLIILTILIKLCCACGMFKRISSFCKTHCSVSNCCQLKSRKEKQTSDKLFFDSMTIALRRDLAPVAPVSNFNANLPNGKSILGEHPPPSHLLYGNNIPLTTTSGCIVGTGANGNVVGTLGRNGNGNHPITMSMDYDDCYQDEDDDDDDDQDEHTQQPHHKLRSQQHYGHRGAGEQLEHCYAPIEPPPPIPLQFPTHIQSLSRKQQQKHQQLLLQQHHGHQHHSPTMGYSPKHYSQHRHHHQQHQHPHHPHSSPKHLQQQQQQQPTELQENNPPVIVHYEYPDFPSMHRVKQVPSVLV